MRIIAFDPGGTTGIAFLELGYPGETADKWDRHSLGPEEHHGALWNILNETDKDRRLDAIVYETFLYQRRDITKGVALELISREYIGVIKLWYEENDGSNWYDLVDQSPSIGKDSPAVFWNDAKLRKLGLWVSSEHERDATRHLLYYVSFTLNDRRFIDQLK